MCQSYSKPKVGRSLRHSVVWPQCFTGDNNGSRWLSHVDRGQHSDGVRLLIAVVAFCLRQSSMTWWSETSWTRTMNFSCSLISQLLLCALWSCLIYQIATSQLVMSGAPFLFPVLPLFIILLPPNPHLFSLFSSILSPFPVLLLLCFSLSFPHFFIPYSEFFPLLLSLSVPESYHLRLHQPTTLSTYSWSWIFGWLLLLFSASNSVVLFNHSQPSGYLSSCWALVFLLRPQNLTYDLDLQTWPR